MSGINVNALPAEYDARSYFEGRNDYLSNWEAISSHFQELVNRIMLHKTGGAFLDVGCGVGILLDVARRSGFDVKGVEVSAWASEFARKKGFDVITGDIATACYYELFFDVIVINHVLEHISDPAALLREVRRIMKDDAMLVIGVPNFDSLAARFKRGDWASLMPDQHIWQFTHNTLGKLLREQGFEEVYFEARDCNKIVGWRPGKILLRLLNIVAVKLNNADAMLVFSRKTE